MDNLKELLKAKREAIKLKYKSIEWLPNHHIFMNEEHYKSFRRRSDLEKHIMTNKFKKLSEDKMVDVFYSKKVSKILEAEGYIKPQK